MKNNTEVRAPQPVQVSYFRDVDPNYGMLKQGADIRLNKEAYANNWFKS